MKRLADREAKAKLHEKIVDDDSDDGFEMKAKINTSKRRLKNQSNLPEDIRNKNNLSKLF